MQSWLGDYTRRPRRRRKKTLLPPLCDITGVWNFVATYMGTEFPSTVSFVQTGNNVTGSGGSNELGLTFTVSGSISGDAIILGIAFNSNGSIGTQVNYGVIDCLSNSMGGTWAHTGGLGLQGTWAGTRIT